MYEDGDGVELTIDVKTLMMADEYSEDAYINITPIAKHFNKKVIPSHPNSHLGV